MFVVLVLGLLTLWVCSVCYCCILLGCPVLLWVVCLVLFLGLIVGNLLWACWCTLQFTVVEFAYLIAISCVGCYGFAGG